MANHDRHDAGVQEGTHQEGKNSQQTGQTNRRAPGDNQKQERALREEGDDRGTRETGYGNAGRKSENQGQKTVQGKNQKGPEDKAGRDIGGGNAGSKGQNASRQRSERDSNTQTGKQGRDR